MRRLASVEETRARVVAAARSCITSGNGLEAFTLDAVAREAGVTRTTVYNQFRSRLGLLEAVCDDIALQGGIRDIDDIIADPDPLRSLGRYVAAFVKLYGTDRVLFRRLFAMASLDAEFGAVLRDRSDRRRTRLRHIVHRIHEQRADGPVSRSAIDDQVLLLKALLGFEVFDTMLEAGQSARKITRQLQELAVATVLQPR